MQWLPPNARAPRLSPRPPPRVPAGQCPHGAARETEATSSPASCFLGQRSSCQTVLTLDLGKTILKPSFSPQSPRFTVKRMPVAQGLACEHHPQRVHPGCELPPGSPPHCVEPQRVSQAGLREPQGRGDPGPRNFPPVPHSPSPPGPLKHGTKKSMWPVGFGTAGRGRVCLKGPAWVPLPELRAGPSPLEGDVTSVSPRVCGRRARAAQLVRGTPVLPKLPRAKAFREAGCPWDLAGSLSLPGQLCPLSRPALRAQVPSRPLYLRQTFSAAVRRGALASVQRRRRQPRTRENLVPHFRRCSASASGIYGLWKPQDGFVQQSGVFLPLTSSPTGNVSPLLCCFFLFLFLGLEIDQGAKGAEKKNALRRCFLHLGGGGTHVSLDNSR